VRSAARIVGGTSKTLHNQGFFDGNLNVQSNN